MALRAQPKRRKASRTRFRFASSPERRVPRRSSLHLRAYLDLAIAMVSLGFSAVFVRWADAPGVVTSFYRMAAAVALLAWPFLRRARAAGGLARRGLAFAGLGGLFFAA